MTKLVNFKWPQGEDLNIQLMYKEGPVKKAVPLNLSTGYSLRMDIVTPTGRTLVYRFDSSSQTDSLRSGTNGPNINIFLPRIVTLPGGQVYNYLSNNQPVSAFSYDIFLRNTVIDKQVRILRGSIMVEASDTLWV